MGFWFNPRAQKLPGVRGLNKKKKKKKKKKKRKNQAIEKLKQYIELRAGSLKR